MNGPVTVSMAFSTLRVERKLPEGDPLWKRLTNSFVTEDVMLSEAAGRISDGYPFTVALKTSNRRKENFLQGQVIGLDFDKGDKSVETLAQDPYISMYAFLIYPTLSSTPEHPKSRVLFALDQPILQLENYERGVRALQWIHGDADPACKDGTRFFFGAGPGPTWFRTQFLPLEVLKRLIGEYENWMESLRKMHVHIPPSPNSGDNQGGAEGLLRWWQEKLQEAAPGTRNVTLIKAAYSMGKAVAAGRISEREAYTGLAWAAAQMGLDAPEYERTIHNGFKAWL